MTPQIAMENCCDKQVIVDRSQGFKSAIGRTNKMCLSCGSHLYGVADDVRFYTRKEWDTWMNEPDEI